MQLRKQGKIDLDEPVITYLPYFKMADERYGSITVRQLLSHTAGVPDVEDWVAEYRDKEPEYDDGALERYVRSLSDVPLRSAPGETWDYSSIGYDILGDVIAKVSGQSFEAYVQEHIFVPLGMTHTTFLVQGVDPAFLMRPHLPAQAGTVAVSDLIPWSRIHGPAGNMFSTLEDMAHYANAHLNRGELDGVSILNPASYDELWKLHGKTWFPPDLERNYGLGWTIGEYKGHHTIGHPGLDDAGYNAFLAILPEQSLTVFMAVNYVDFNTPVFPAFMLREAVLDVLLGIQK
jgi:CubicO group peptidase (beta-lactamase class C family)